MKWMNQLRVAFTKKLSSFEVRKSNWVERFCATKSRTRQVQVNLVYLEAQTSFLVSAAGRIRQSIFLIDNHRNFWDGIFFDTFSMKFGSIYWRRRGWSPSGKVPSILAEGVGAWADQKSIQFFRKHENCCSLSLLNRVSSCAHNYRIYLQIKVFYGYFVLSQ